MREAMKAPVEAADKIAMNEPVQDSTRNDETPGEQSEIIVISSDDSSSASSWKPVEAVKTTHMRGPKRAQAHPVEVPRRSPLHITLGPGEPLQAFGPMGLPGGRADGNGRIAQFRRMLDEFDPDDPPKVQKKKMDEVVSPKKTHSPKQQKRKMDEVADSPKVQKRKKGELVTPKTNY